MKNTRFVRYTNSRSEPVQILIVSAVFGGFGAAPFLFLGYGLSALIMFAIAFCLTMALFWFYRLRSRNR